MTRMGKRNSSFPQDASIEGNVRRDPIVEHTLNPNWKRNRNKGDSGYGREE